MHLRPFKLKPVDSIDSTGSFDPTQDEINPSITRGMSRLKTLRQSFKLRRSRSANTEVSFDERSDNSRQSLKSTRSAFPTRSDSLVSRVSTVSTPVLSGGGLGYRRKSMYRGRHAR